MVSRPRYVLYGTAGAKSSMLMRHRCVHRTQLTISKRARKPVVRDSPGKYLYKWYSTSAVVARKAIIKALGQIDGTLRNTDNDSGVGGLCMNGMDAYFSPHHVGHCNLRTFRGGW